MAKPKRETTQRYFLMPALTNCVAPTTLLCLTALLSYLEPGRLLSNSILGAPVIWGAIPLVCGALYAVFRAHFNDSVHNALVWISIALSGIAVIVFFGCLYQSEGLLCTAPVCPSTTTVQVTQPRLHARLGEQPPPWLPFVNSDTSNIETVAVDFQFKSAFYFSTVTFTTLGYGDFQPSPRLRILAGLQAILGYGFLGICVGLLIDLGNVRPSLSSTSKQGPQRLKPPRKAVLRKRRQHASRSRNFCQTSSISDTKKEPSRLLLSENDYAAINPKEPPAPE